MDNKKVNHIAIAVPNIEKAALSWEKALGMEKSEIMILKDHGVKVVFLEFANLKIELLEPLNNESPITKFLKKNPKGGIHHICFEIKNIRDTIKVLKEKKINILGDGNPKNGAHEKPVIFLHPNDLSGTLVELEET
ncbi:MAG: methylmalonyl-CoA epimerase [SAR116 cluster bacterium]|nr:methylmalonyl-CoA epimerase [SAR116 cluster bacterium]RPH09716.1 MAG: methylmalonyl-CoA epimerase [Alphaproteobacteria bacterium TMED54]|tara:strand:+ start:380 stop:787 length:408 start_codon:yes stop_codon:yes gene_type:complete